MADRKIETPSAHSTGLESKTISGGGGSFSLDFCFYRTGQLLREHLRQKRGGHRIQEQDLSPRRPWKVSQLLLRAERAGTQIGALCHHIDPRQGQLGVRRIQGVLSLVKKYGTAATEDACAAALEMGVPEYRFVRRYLERTPQLSLWQVDPLIRELVHYRDLIQQKTQEPKS